MSAPSAKDLRAVGTWVVAEGLRGATTGELLAGYCDRLNRAGVPLWRGYITQGTLHPIYAAHGFHWQRDHGPTEREDYELTDIRPKAWRESPFRHMLDNHMPRLRESLMGNQPLPFPILEDLRARGGTDYLAMTVRFGDDERPEPVRGILTSWTSDDADGFSEDHVAALESQLPGLSLAVKNASTLGIATNLIETYIGRDAGRRVLSGEIQRGSVEAIEAVLFYCDLEGFTRIADSHPHDQVLAMLNSYFEAVVDAVHARGGEVLKFMGDGLVAIFKLEEQADVCRHALDAAEAALAATAKVQRTRAADGWPAPGLRLALHLGEVMYGNIGARDRLDFTVVGAAVNEASRIESMCRSLDQRLIVSSAFAAAAGPCRDRLVSLGRYALRGVRMPQELFTLDVAATADAAE